MHRKSLPLPLFVFAILAWLPSAAWAAAAGVETLPGVENESTSATVPAITPEQVQRTGVARATAPAMAESEPAAPAIRFDSQGEARDKIRRAYLLQNYDEVQRLGRAALAEWPDDAAFQYYVTAAGEKLAQPAAPTDKESPYRRLRDENREKELKALLHKVGETGRTPAPVAATRTPTATPAPGAARTPAVVPPVRQRPNVEPPVVPTTGESALGNLKATLGKPAVLGAIGGIIVLGLIVVVLLRRKPAARKEAEAAFKPEAAKGGAAAVQEPAETPQPAMTPLSAAEELDSLFKPASSQTVAATASDTAGIDALFDAPTEPPTRVSPPTPQPEPEPEPEITLEAAPESEPIGAPIRLDEPIQLMPVQPPEAPVVLPEIAELEPVTIAAEPEIIPPINISFPEEDPFFKRADEPAPATAEESTLDLPSLDVTAQEPTVAAAPESFFQPVMPDIMEPPSIQPELANTDSYVIARPTPEPAAEETVSAEADLPTIDTTPSVSVHQDETVALDADTQQLMQETAVSPDIPPPVRPPAAEAKASAGDDLFNREYQKGLSEFGAENWAGAVHHLSIAAALKPASADVKEKLREARRRRKESGGE